MKSFKKILMLFCIGGIGYGLIEILWRGYTHWSMMLTGGLCFSAIVTLFQKYSHIKWYYKALMGAGIITSAEFVVGVIVNLVFQWQVWDYSAMKFNLLGQICPQFTFLWFLLCTPIALYLTPTLSRKSA